MKDSKIIEQLRQGKRKRAFQSLYKGYPAVEKLILGKGGTKEQAQDIFQESLIVFYKKAIQPDFKLTAKVSTYLYSVSRYLWKDEQRKMNAHKGQIATNLTEEQFDFSQEIEHERKLKLAEKALKSLGEKCLEILQLFYHQQRSMKFIAERMGLSSEKVAKNQKYKCLERARNRWQQMNVQS